MRSLRPQRKPKQMSKTVHIFGAGLAGCEAAWQVARRGVKVKLYEMKPQKYTPAHHTPEFAELVCSNSLRSDSAANAVGLLKEDFQHSDIRIIAHMSKSVKNILKNLVKSTIIYLK